MSILPTGGSWCFEGLAQRARDVSAAFLVETCARKHWGFPARRCANQAGEQSSDLSRDRRVATAGGCFVGRAYELCFCRPVCPGEGDFGTSESVCHPEVQKPRF